MCIRDRALLEHGQWLPYLKEQTEFSQPSASRLMRLYDEYGAKQTSLFGAELNYSTLNNLSISNALRLLAVPEDEREEFALEHDVEHMSARELDELIKQRDEAEKLSLIHILYRIMPLSDAAGRIRTAP